jgi:hypothetical protein
VTFELNSFRPGDLVVSCAAQQPPVPTTHTPYHTSIIMVYTIVVHLRAKKGNEEKLAAKLKEASEGAC